MLTASSPGALLRAQCMGREGGANKFVLAPAHFLPKQFLGDPLLGLCDPGDGIPFGVRCAPVLARKHHDSRLFNTHPVQIGRVLGTCFDDAVYVCTKGSQKLATFSSKIRCSGSNCMVVRVSACAHVTHWPVYSSKTSPPTNNALWC